jgi:hypothetical protein
MMLERIRADYALAVTNQVLQKIEHLRLQRYENAPVTQFAAGGIESIVFELKEQFANVRDGPAGGCYTFSTLPGEEK